MGSCAILITLDACTRGDTMEIFGKGISLAASFICGLGALTLQSVAIGTDYWVESQYNPETEIAQPTNASIDYLIKNGGLWRSCFYHLTTNNETLCQTNNFTVEPNQPGYDYYNIIANTSVTASAFACICLCLAFFGVLTGVQTLWQLKSSLFIDCGLMFLFAAIANAVGLSIYIFSIVHLLTKRPEEIGEFPIGYDLPYAWSFFCAWGTFVLCFIGGTHYLLIARHFREQERWQQPMEEEKKPSALIYKRTTSTAPPQF